MYSDITVRDKVEQESDPCSYGNDGLWSDANALTGPVLQTHSSPRFEGPVKRAASPEDSSEANGGIRGGRSARGRRGLSSLGGELWSIASSAVTRTSGGTTFGEGVLDGLGVRGVREIASPAVRVRCRVGRIGASEMEPYPGVEEIGRAHV